MNAKLAPVLAMITFGCIAGCATDADSHGDDELSDQDGKGDGYGYEIRFGSYVNDSVYDGEIATLELSEAAASELPAAHFEGRYSLTEKDGAASTASSGFFNVYKHRGDLFIKFLDGSTGGYETKFPRYSWIYWEDTLVMNGTGEDEFFLRLPFYGTKLDCELKTLHDDNVFEEGLSMDEYPDVDLQRDAVTGRIKASIGSWSFDSTDSDAQPGSKLELSANGATATVTIPYGSDDVIKVVGPARGTGTATISVVAGSAVTKVATLSCKGTTVAAP